MLNIYKIVFVVLISKLYVIKEEETKLFITEQIIVYKRLKKNNIPIREQTLYYVKDEKTITQFIAE